MDLDIKIRKVIGKAVASSLNMHGIKDELIHISCMT